MISSGENNLEALFAINEWRQRISLPGGIFTPGTRCEYEWEDCFMPSDLHGKSFLDVGANDGMFSFLAESKGAVRIVAADIYTDVTNTTDLNMQNGWSVSRISMIRQIKKSSVEIVPCSVYDLGKTLSERFDYVFCGNVIAWLDSPVAAIRELSARCTDTLIIREDLSRKNGRPSLEYVNNSRLTGCYFMGNKEFYMQLLTSLGFNQIVFKKIDTYRIFEKRSDQFKKYIVEKGTKYFKHPFDGAESAYSNRKVEEVVSSIVNGKAFINRLGWVDPSSLKKLPEAIPVNPIRRKLFEGKWRSSNPDNYIIIAKRK